jgi:hypothetical protein
MECPKTSEKGEKGNKLVKRCTLCLKPATKVCSRCHFYRYCSLECQKKDWPKHKVDCEKQSAEEGMWLSNQIKRMVKDERAGKIWGAMVTEMLGRTECFVLIWKPKGITHLTLPTGLELPEMDGDGERVAEKDVFVPVRMKDGTKRGLVDIMLANGRYRAIEVMGTIAEDIAEELRKAAKLAFDTECPVMI